MAQNCPSQEMLENFAAGETNAAETAQIMEHLAHCVECRAALALLREARRSYLSALDASAKSHLPFNTILEYADGNLSSQELPKVKMHLCLCDRCFNLAMNFRAGVHYYEHAPDRGPSLTAGIAKAKSLVSREPLIGKIRRAAEVVLDRVNGALDWLSVQRIPSAAFATRSSAANALPEEKAVWNGDAELPGGKAVHLRMIELDDFSARAELSFSREQAAQSVKNVRAEISGPEFRRDVALVSRIVDDIAYVYLDSARDHGRMKINVEFADGESSDFSFQIEQDHLRFAVGLANRGMYFLAEKQLQSAGSAPHVNVCRGLLKLMQAAQLRAEETLPENARGRFWPAVSGLSPVSKENWSEKRKTEISRGLRDITAGAAQNLSAAELQLAEISKAFAALYGDREYSLPENSNLTRLTRTLLGYLLYSEGAEEKAKACFASAAGAEGTVPAEITYKNDLAERTEAFDRLIAGLRFLFGLSVEKFLN